MSSVALIRPFAPGDEEGWVRCRALSFLHTQYFDDVKPQRTRLVEPFLALVATDSNSDVVGILDIEIDGATATIDTIAVHPDHQGRRIGTDLLQAAVPDLARRGVTTLDADTGGSPRQSLVSAQRIR